MRLLSSAERTRTSASLVQAILLAAETRYVPTAAETQRARQKPVYETLTAEQIVRR